tara:strand:+ start:8863 stop:9165 length:303 start_codon:yes stop_codon:yes gene_type:complete
MLDKMNAPDIVRDDDPDPELNAAHNLDPEALIPELLRLVEAMIQVSNKTAYIAQDLHELVKGISDATETPIPQSPCHYGERSLGLPAGSSDSSDQSSRPF